MSPCDDALHRTCEKIVKFIQTFPLPLPLTTPVMVIHSQVSGCCITHSFISLVILLFLFVYPAVDGFVIDSESLGVASGPYFMVRGPLATYKFAKLVTYLTHKPRTSKVVHVVPLRQPDGSVVTSTHVDVSKPFHYDYINAPLPHLPITPDRLKSPAERYSQHSSSPYSHRHLIGPTHLYKRLAPVVSPPYLPIPLIYASQHQFSSPYW